MINVNYNLDLINSNSKVVELIDLGNGVVQITMKDEENCNTFSPKIIEGLYKCFGAVAQNTSYKVVILTGYGNYFCSGGTKEELIKIYNKEIQFDELDFFRILLDCQIPVIAAMQGHSIGGGFVFGLYADLVVLSQESIYTTNFMKYGFTPGLGCTFIVPTKLGFVFGQEMMYTAQNYRGEELAQRGIPFPVVPRKEVLNHAQSLANKIAEKPRLSLVTLKEHLTSEIRDKLPKVLKKELKMHEITFHQPEVANRIETIYNKTNTCNNLLQLKTSSYGLLNNLTLAPLQRRIPQSTEVEVQIKAVAVNFRDVLNALGMLEEYNHKKLGITSVENLTFGFEGVGTITAVGAEVTQWQVGNEVMVIGVHNAFSSFIICSPNNLVAKPSNLDIVSAATIPIPFFTAFHGLYNLAKIQPGERVLIHAAAGGTGQAAVQLAQLMGAEVFATASPSKMAFLQEQGIKHVMNSRTTEFANDVMEITQGCGVDVIFSSLTHGEYIQKNIDILALGGRYIEIGKLNLWSHEQVYQKRADIKYLPFDLGDEFARDNQLFSQIWGKLVHYFECRRLKPLHYKAFPIKEVVESFRHIQHSKHIGRIIVTMPESSYWEEKLDSHQLSNQNEPINEDVLHQLQLGKISLEKAESLLLGFIGEEVPDITIEKNNTHNGHNKLINQENVLHQLQSGEISLEKAESLLLGFIGEEVPDIIIEKNDTHDGNNKLINQENVLHQLQSDEPQINTSIYTSITNPVQNRDIAIIGMSCRYPGAKNWQEFWENLKNGVDNVTEAPSGRWQGKKWYHPDPGHPGTSYSKYAGFLDEIDKFDPLFFQISPVEAQFIEPQQRIFLEEAYHAIEDAGYSADSLKGKQCGVFVGAGTNGDYSKLLSIAELDTHRLALTGNLLSMIPARIAYFLDLRGPVVTVDTACSSSLVAVHQACESIQRGDAEIALAGGIAIMPTADFQVLSSQFQMLSAAGRCKTFDASASGTVWSEGCGIILLKSYEQAIHDNDHIYAVIKGTGVNYDGNTNGISAPSSQSQTRLEEAVYQKFGINPETISYVEAHGTATPLGDPIEIEALTEAFSKWTKKKQFCAIGSVKTNIGHAATSAGISGLIKTILCLKNQKLVPSLHFNQPNPHIDFKNSPFYVNTEFKDWQVLDGNLRRAAVSSFGFSGTNAHLVIEEAPSQIKSQNSKLKFSERSHHILTLSAKCEKALQDIAQEYEKFLQSSTAAIPDICFSANTGRSHFDYRLALIVESKEKLIQQLKTFATREETTGLLKAQVMCKERAKIAFLFTGQGSEYVNMGRELYFTQPIFRKTLEECDRILRLYLDIRLLSILYPKSGDTSVIDKSVYAQPALFAIEYALVQLWKSWGIEPDVVMGCSIGEYVAACVAGVFTLEDGLKLIAHRGKLMQALEMEVAIAAEYELIATQINYKTPKISLISNVTGKRLDENIITAKYWVHHLKEPVKFVQSIETLSKEGNFVFLEISPKPILLDMGRQYLPSLRPGVEDWQQMLNSLAQMYLQGIEVNWSGFDSDYNRCKVTLPTYPFQRQRYWVDTAKDERQKVESKQENISSTNTLNTNISSPIYNLLCKGEIETVSNELEKLGVLSEDEIKLLPKLLKLLVEQNQQQLNIASTSFQNQAIKSEEILAAEPEKRQEILRYYISQLLAKIINVSPSTLNWQRRLSELGFDSLMATELRKSIESDLKVNVPVEYFSELNLEQFLSQIHSLIKQKNSNCSVEIVADETQKWFKFPQKNSKPLLRLFCFPHAGGSTFVFNSWLEKFASNIEICPIQLPGRGHRLKEPAFTKIKPLIQTLTSLLKPYLDVPFAFFGHSMGALLSFELARELRRQNCPAPLQLFVSGYRAPHIPDLNLPIYKLPETKFVQALSSYGGIPENILQDQSLMKAFIPTFRSDFELLDTYFYMKEDPLEVPIYAFGGLEDAIVSIKELAAWEEQTKANFNLKMFNGDHFYLRGVEDEIIKFIQEVIYSASN